MSNNHEEKKVKDGSTKAAINKLPRLSPQLNQFSCFMLNSPLAPTRPPWGESRITRKGYSSVCRSYTFCLNYSLSISSIYFSLKLQFEILSKSLTGIQIFIFQCPFQVGLLFFLHFQETNKVKIWDIIFISMLTVGLNDLILFQPKWVYELFIICAKN